MYAIKQTYWDIQGNSWSRLLKHRFKTTRNAEKSADRSYRWMCVDPKTKEVTEESNAEIVEVRK